MVLDDKGLGGYHAIFIEVAERGEENPAQIEFFVGRFARDQKYHLLGERPASLADGRQMFSEASEARGDHGIVKLPEGKASLRQCVKGDILTVTPHLQGAKPYQITYIGHNG